MICRIALGEWKAAVNSNVVFVTWDVRSRMLASKEAIADRVLEGELCKRRAANSKASSIAMLTPSPA